jgi:uncharacterized protein YigA (DUF484 family)
LPSPHGSGAISLAERQQLAQRDKIDVLKQRFAELVSNAQENDAIAIKIHALNIELHKTKSFDEIEQLVSSLLPEHFNLSDTCLRIWAKPVDPEDNTNLVFSEVPEETKTWIASLAQPYCGLSTALVAEDWFIEPASSIALIPLKLKKSIGFLALSSDDANRFYADKGTDFLTRIGEILSAALSRHLD